MGGGAFNQLCMRLVALRLRLLLPLLDAPRGLLRARRRRRRRDGRRRTAGSSPRRNRDVQRSTPPRRCLTARASSTDGSHRGRRLDRRGADWFLGVASAGGLARRNTRRRRRRRGGRSHALRRHARRLGRRRGSGSTSERRGDLRAIGINAVTLKPDIQQVAARLQVLLLVLDALHATLALPQRQLLRRRASTGACEGCRALTSSARHPHRARPRGSILSFWIAAVCACAPCAAPRVSWLEQRRRQNPAWQALCPGTLAAS